MAARSLLRIAFTGDSIVTRRGIFNDAVGSQELRDLLRGVDIVFTNLEVLPNDFQGDPARESGGSHLAAPAAVLDDLVASGFNLFAFANNHSLDYSISGLLASMRALAARGITYAGVGTTLANARMPVYASARGGTVALLSCCSTFASGQEAGAQSADMQGRPGLNPLHVDVTYEVTPAQLEVLRTIARDSGAERERLDRIRMGFAFPPDDPTIVPLGGINFRPGEKPAVRCVARKSDIEAILRWVRDARSRSDVVVLSVHGHEQGSDKETPAEFQTDFAKRAIDEGADVVVCHGPHLLRGLEFYRGKPIFYSLGNFIGQNELVYKVPADSYERFRIDADKTPADLYRLRYADDRRSFPSDRRYWETVVPVCTYSDGSLETIDIYPVHLGFGEKPHRRGRPRFAPEALARAILDRFSALSRPFGTRCPMHDGRITIDLAGVVAERRGVS